LAHNARAVCSQGYAESHFSRALAPPGEQQIGNIRASDQQHTAYRQNQQYQQRLCLTYGVSSKGINFRLHANRARVCVLLHESISDTGDILLRLLFRYTRL